MFLILSLVKPNVDFLFPLDLGLMEYRKTNILDDFPFLDIIGFSIFPNVFLIIFMEVLPNIIC